MRRQEVVGRWLVRRQVDGFRYEHVRKPCLSVYRLIPHVHSHPRLIHKVWSAALPLSLHILRPKMERPSLAVEKLSLQQHVVYGGPLSESGIEMSFSVLAAFHSW